MLATSVTMVNGISLARFTSAIDLARLRADLRTMRIGEFEIIYRLKLRKETRATYDSAQQEAFLLLRKLKRDNPERHDLFLATNEFLEYKRRLLEALDAMQKGQVQKARTLDVKVIDPLGDRVQQRINVLGITLEREFDSAHERSSMFAFYIILGLFGLLALAWITIERQRLSSVSLQIQTEASRLQEEHLKSIVRHSYDIILVLNHFGTVKYCSPAVEHVLGFGETEWIGKDFSTRLHTDDINSARSTLALLVEGTQMVEREWRAQGKDGSERVFDVVLCRLLDDSHVNGILVTLHDMTKQKEYESELTRHAFYDALTGLANRALLLETMDRSLQKAKAKRSQIGLLFIDLDNFKVVNDSLGHDAGDELLREIAERLKTCAGPGDMAARLGGDEFVVFMEDASYVRAQEIADRLIASLKEVTSLNGHEVFASSSVGFAISGPATENASQLIREADLAMYSVKSNGKSGFAAFEESMNESIKERLELESGLNTAIEKGELEVHYQPILDLAGAKVLGAEALLRWNHPERGLIGPSKFIPIAEESGLIVTIGSWVLEQAATRARKLLDEGLFSDDMTISVNLSGRQLRSSTLVEEVAQVLLKTGLPAHNLKLEITESMMILGTGGNTEKLKQLKELGVKLAVDDFGTGYSSMACLSGMPLDTLKIDRAFIEKLGQDPESDAIVRAIVSLAKTLSLDVTSEGIENIGQVRALQELGCEAGQGFLYANPLQAEEFSAFLGSILQASEFKKAA